MEHVKIYQGNQIGGCVTVISSMINGEIHRIMVDYGSSLPGSDNEKDFDYPWDEEPVDAVFFTHYHGDHVGRIMEIPSHIPLYMGDVARQAMINIQEALGKNPHMSEEEAELHLEEAAVLKDDKRVKTFKWNGTFYDHVKDIEGFVVEPYSVDHSAYDAYMFLFEACDPDTKSGKYIAVHTGDFRGHGRRGHKMLTLIKKYIRRFNKRSIDALVIEGTMMSRSCEKVISESQMQFNATKYLMKHKYAFLICSSTNVDSLASFYQAAQDAVHPYGRNMYVYSYYFIKYANGEVPASRVLEIVEDRNPTRTIEGALEIEGRYVSSRVAPEYNYLNYVFANDADSLIRPGPYYEIVKILEVENKKFRLYDQYGYAVDPEARVKEVHAMYEYLEKNRGFQTGDSYFEKINELCEAAQKKIS